MSARKEFEMTQEELDEILDACKPVPYMVFAGMVPRSPQENANDAWDRLGMKLGFRGCTVGARSGKVSTLLHSGATAMTAPEKSPEAGIKKALALYLDHNGPGRCDCVGCQDIRRALTATPRAEPGDVKRYCVSCGMSETFASDPPTHIDRLAAAPSSEGAKCYACDKPATCLGYSDMETAEQYACDDCCGHGQEDGQCRPVASREGAREPSDIEKRLWDATFVVNNPDTRNLLHDARAALATAPSEAEPAVCELMLCESTALLLQPDKLYRFTVDPKCRACVERARVVDPRNGEWPLVSPTPESQGDPNA